MARDRAWRRRQRWLKRNRDQVRCSCWMCGNPRRIYGERTVRERLVMQETADDDVENENLVQETA